MPLIRITRTEEKWLYKDLKEVKDVRDGTHSSPKYIDNGYPLVTSKNLTDSGLNLNDVSLISESDYNEINKRSKVEVGDILLGLIGTIGKPVLVETDGFAIKNVGLIKNGGQIQNQFLLQYLKTNLFNKYIQIEMAGNTQKFLGLETLRNTKVPVPSSEEQSAIGSLFRILDDLLASYKDNLANYQSLKATMLSKMFPKAGQTVPEIRLDGFEGEWKKLKLREVVHTNPKSELPENFKYIDLESVVGTRIEKIREERKESAPSRAQRLAKKGDVFYQTVRPYQKNNYLFKLDEIDYVFSTGYAQLRPICKRCDSDFLLILLQNNRFLNKVLDRCTGTSYPAINVNDLIEIPSYEEQQAIGSYFSTLENVINSHQEKISQLETLKKKLLQDMFI